MRSRGSFGRLRSVGGEDQASRMLHAPLPCGNHEVGSIAQDQVQRLPRHKCRRHRSSDKRRHAWSKREHDLSIERAVCRRRPNPMRRRGMVQAIMRVDDGHDQAMGMCVHGSVVMRNTYPLKPGMVLPLLTRNMAAAQPDLAGYGGGGDQVDRKIERQR